MNTIALALLLLAPNPGTGIITAPGVYLGDGTPRNQNMDTNGNAYNIPQMVAGSTYPSRTDYFPSGAGTRGRQTSLPADFNGDGIPDFAVTFSSSNLLYVYLGTGNGAFKFSGSYATGNSPRGATVADFNEDGIMDLAVCNLSDSTVGTFLGKGDGTFGTMTTFATAADAPTTMVAGKLSSSTHWSLVVADSNSGGAGFVTVLTGNGNNTFLPHVEYSSGGNNAFDLELADLNGDGLLDIAVSNFASSPGNVATLQGLSDGGFAAANAFNLTQTGYPSGSGPAGVAVGDLNGDFVPDVIVSDEITGAWFFPGVGDTTLGSPTFYPSTVNQTGHSLNALDVVTGDFNGDGRLDFAMSIADVNTVPHNDGLLFFLNNGTASFTQVFLPEPGLTPGYMTGFDFNADGITDLLTTSWNIAKGTVSAFISVPPVVVVPKPGSVFFTQPIANPSQFNCFVDNATAQSLCQVAPSSERLYVTGAEINAGATALGVDIGYGNSLACDGGLTQLTPVYQLPINGGLSLPLNFTAPLGKSLCCAPSSAHAFSCQITGYVAP